jgi:hypothetical protein
MAAAYRILLAKQSPGGREGVAAILVDATGKILSWGLKNPAHPALHGETTALLGRDVGPGLRGCERKHHRLRFQRNGPRRLHAIKPYVRSQDQQVREASNAPTRTATSGRCLAI